jgi:hypothetical protein
MRLSVGPLACLDLSVYELISQHYFTMSFRLGVPEQRRIQKALHNPLGRSSQTVRPPGGGGLLVLSEDASCLYKGHIYFERNMDARQNIYFDRHFAWLKYFTYRLVP